MTEAQLNANRENAKKSTGPRTSAGKANSSRNATTHGLTGANRFLPGEDPSRYQRLRDDLYTRFRPVGEGEEKLVDVIADAQWRISRIAAQEAGIYRDNFWPIHKQDKFQEDNYNRTKAEAKRRGEPRPTLLTLPDPEDLAARAFNLDCAGSSAILKLSRHETALGRSIDRSLRQLKIYQAARMTSEQAETVVQSPDETVAEETPTPPNAINYKTNPMPGPNPAPELPSEPLETFRTDPRASNGPAPPRFGS